MALSLNVNLVALALLVGIPFVFDSFTAYEIGLYLIFGLVSLSVALCWGQTGFLPLGQGLFFGFGAYLYGFSVIEESLFLSDAADEVCD